jgi:hypothetical protein
MTTTNTAAELALASLRVGDLIQTGCNGRWTTPARVISLGETFASGYGGIARTVEWASPTGNGSYSSCLGSRDLGRFWQPAAAL